MVNNESPTSVVAYCSVLEDRRQYNKRHCLRDILVIAICAAMAGADGWSVVALFGKAEVLWLREVLIPELPHGIPSPDYGILGHPLANSASDAIIGLS